MTSGTLASRTEVDRYLEALRRRLRRLPPEQAQDIVEEIRSHIYDVSQLDGEVSESTVSVVLNRLGSPAALASTYISENIVSEVRLSRSPLVLFRSTLRWASLSIAGMFGFFGVLAGYGLAAAFGLCALSKVFNPAKAGLWKLGGDDFTLQLGIGGPPPTPGSHELLGWWIVPIGLVASVVLILLTTEITRFAIRTFYRELPRLSSHYSGNPT